MTERNSFQIVGRPAFDSPKPNPTRLHLLFLCNMAKVATETQIRELLRDPSLSNDLKEAIQQGYSLYKQRNKSSNLSLAMANKLPTGGGNGQADIQLRKSRAVFELTYAELVQQYDVRLRLRRRHGLPRETAAAVAVMDEADEQLQATTQPVSAAKRRAMTETVTAATHLSDLPADLIALIMDAYSDRILGSRPDIGWANKYLHAIQRQRMVKITGVADKSVAKSYYAGPLNACLVGLLQVAIRFAPVANWTPFQWAAEFEKRDGRLSEESVPSWHWDFPGELSGCRREIHLGMCTQQRLYDVSTSKQTLYRLRWRELMGIRYMDVSEPGGITYNARNVEYPPGFSDVFGIELRTIPTSSSLATHSDRLRYDAKRLFDHSLSEMYGASADPKTLDWEHGFWRTVYGKSWLRQQRLKSPDGNNEDLWRQVLEPRLVEAIRYPLERDPFRANFQFDTVATFIPLKPEHAAWARVAGVLELARCADETSTVEVDHTLESNEDPDTHLVVGLRTNIAQCSHSLEILSGAVGREDDNFSESLLPGLDELGQTTYWLSVCASLRVKYNNLGPYTESYDSEMRFARSLRQWLYMLLLPLKKQDKQLAWDFASCLTIYIHTASQPWATIQQPAEGHEEPPFAYSAIDTEGFIHIAGSFTPYINVARIERLFPATSDSNSEFLMYRIDANRTKLRQLLARHELGTHTAFAAYWSYLEPHIAGNVSPQSTDEVTLARAEELFLAV